MQSRNAHAKPASIAVLRHPPDQGLAPTSERESAHEAPPKIIVGEARRYRWLVQFGRTDQGPRVITGPQLRLGTSDDNDIVLRGHGVAPLHCTLRREGSLIRLYDHGSILGTLTDGQPVHEPTILHGATRLLLGHQEITIRALAPPPSTDSLKCGFLPIPAHQLEPTDQEYEAPEVPDIPEVQQYQTSPRRWPLPAFFAVITGSTWITLALMTRTPASPHSANSPPPLGLSQAGRSRSKAEHSPSHSLSHAASPHASQHPAQPQTTGSTYRTITTPQKPSTHHLRSEPDFVPSSESGPRKGSPGSVSAAHNLDVPPGGPWRSGPEARGHRVERGETWASIANAQGIPRTHLRTANNDLRRPLREGDRLQMPEFAIRPSPTLSQASRHSCSETIEIPSGAHSIGGVTLGSLDNPIRMPKLDLYELRCPRHSYTTAATARGLIDAIACFRGQSRYSGEIIIGDISRECGGSLGPHRSHQSGRDVDLWLPIAGGRYGRGCDHCGTDFCRPEPQEVDWDTTWALVEALAARPEIEVVFLDFDLQAKLRQSALANGADPATLDAAIQWPRRGAPALVQHSAGHVHHMHIRFRCPLGDQNCDARSPSVHAAKAKPPMHADGALSAGLATSNTTGPFRSRYGRQSGFLPLSQETRQPPKRTPPTPLRPDDGVPTR